jgi:nicotinate-nucleotide adenylyltransferase
MKVGILGGSFNPIHNGHLTIFQRVLGGNYADEVWVMPCKKHPLDKHLDKEEDRVAMVKLAVEGLDRTKFSDFELNHEGKNYTYLTLRRLRECYNHDFSWIIGSDILKQLPTWYGFGYLQKEASFIVLNREGYFVENPGINISAQLDEPISNISSTRVRERIRKGKSITDLVPRSVENYIFQNKLYL